MINARLPGAFSLRRGDMLRLRYSNARRYQ
jgi:hypothetical protein